VLRGAKYLHKDPRVRISGLLVAANKQHSGMSGLWGWVQHQKFCSAFPASAKGRAVSLSFRGGAATRGEMGRV
jgi:hypothetical protein